MNTFRYYPGRTPKSVRRSLELIVEEFPIRPCSSASRANVDFHLSSDGPGLEHVDSKTTISGATIPQLLRSLASLQRFAHEKKVPTRYREKPHFDMLGLMLDASRNAVPRAETVKYILRRMALMGLNMLMLYTEDTYSVPGQPYIGYLRGKYSKSELRELDAYARNLGIEMVPCIQTLGHLGQMLRWPAYAALKDQPNILLADEPKTYKLLEQMIAAASGPFRSKRIHLGMDEAHGLGLGDYLKQYPYTDPYQIMLRHLGRANKIAKSLGLRPMIWSDMFFRLGSKNRDYYDPRVKIPRQVRFDIPADVDLVYWDYYHLEQRFYREWIRHHRTLGKEPIFAGGLWTSGVFWQNINWARMTIEAGMQACKTEGLRQAFVTAWADDGAEVNMLSLLPGLQCFAEHAYQERVCSLDLEKQLRAACGIELKDWTTASHIDSAPFSLRINDILRSQSVTDSRVKKAITEINDIVTCANPSKTLLWQDPLSGLYDVHLKGVSASGYYRKLARQLTKAMSHAGQNKPWLKLPRDLSLVLQYKAELGLTIFQAYHEKDRQALRRICESMLPQTLRMVKKLHRTHKNLWMQLYKPQGWEVLDVRYGGLLARLTHTRNTLGDYLTGKTEKIEELEEKRLPVHSWKPGQMGFGQRYRDLISPSVIT